MAARTPATESQAPGVFFSIRDSFSLSAKLDPVDGYSHVMAGDIAAALTDNGWPCQAFPTWTLKNEIALFRPGRYGFVMGFNLIPDMEVGETDRGDKITFYNMWRKHSRTPVIAVLIDQAFHHLGRIRKYLPLADDLALAVLERSDMPFLQGAGIPSERMAHLPWGGPPPDAKPKPFGQRRHDLVFHGGLPAAKTETEFQEQFLALGASVDVVQAMSRAVETIVEEGAGVESAVRAGLRSRGIESDIFNIDQFCKLLQMTERQARTIGRHRFLTAFADLPVHFFGDFPADFQRGFPRATFHAGVPFRRIIEVTRDAKLSLSDTIGWRENAHLRLTYAIPYGCLPVAERNPRLERDFTDMKNIIFTAYPHRDAADKARAVLDDPRRGQDMVDAARPIYEARYTWRETVKVLAPFLPPPVPPAERKPAEGKAPRKASRPKSAPKARPRRGRRRGSRR